MANFEPRLTSRGRLYTRRVSPTATTAHTARRRRSASLLRRYARPNAWHDPPQTPPASPASGYQASGSNRRPTCPPSPVVRTPLPTVSRQPVLSLADGQGVTITTTCTTTIVTAPTLTARRSRTASVPSTPSRSQAKARPPPFRTPQKQAKVSPMPQRHTALDEIRFPDPSTFQDLRGMAPKKYYVIAKGRKVGIFVTWTQITPWIKDVVKPVYESFVSFDRAYDCYRDAFRDGYLEVIEGKGQNTVVISQPPPLPVPPRVPASDFSDSEDELSSESDLTSSTAVPPSPSMQTLSHQVECPSGIRGVFAYIHVTPVFTRYVYKHTRCISATLATKTYNAPIRSQANDMGSDIGPMHGSPPLSWDSPDRGDIYILHAHRQDTTAYLANTPPLQDGMGHHLSTEIERKDLSTRAKSKAYYAANQAWLQKRNRERAASRKTQMTDEERDAARAQHNINAARYRQRNRRVLRENASEYRRRQKAEREEDATAEEEAEEMARLEASQE
ncbi:hypothetical protein FPV67DRAFT_1669299 [Lyophyllum atratum]|nr:hypothetical protein FPV67DRAFT_1669299 [Lyophyllum atratum]